MRVIFLLIIFSIFAFGEDCDHILRFSSTKRTDHFTVSSNLLRYHSCDGLSDWVSIRFSENHLNIYFEAKKAPSFEDRKSVTFTVHYDGSNSFEQVISEPRTYRFLCQWDDEGAISEDKDYSASLLFDEEGFISLGPDMDKWSFKPKNQGYCLEVAATNDFVLQARQGLETFGDPVEIIGEAFSKRLYITNALMNQQIDFTISRPENSEAADIKYSFSLKPVRPLVLVHGIRSNPTWHNDHGTSFGDLKAKACRYGAFPPCIVFDFPWDSSNGSIEDYCGDKGSEFNLYGFTHKRCGDWKLKPVFFTHSMGGLLLAEQMKKTAFREAAGGAIFAGSPFCGSDIANVM
ncbi:hypothetical protein IJS98_02080, partial [bacterium]|nr:hypothetical protein [bacterium]